MPRVLFVHHRPHAGGAARSLKLLIGALGAEWEAHVLCPGGLSAREFEQAGATVHIGPVPAFVHTWDAQYHGLRWLVAGREAAWVVPHRRQLRALLNSLRPDLVHLNDAVQLPSAATVKTAGVPITWHLRSSLPHDGRDRRSRWITRFIDGHASAAVAIDEDVAATYRLSVPLSVVPNPVIAGDGPRAPLELPPGQVSVGLVGYLRRQKGWPEFLAAIHDLVRRNVPAHAVVVGGGVRSSDAFRGLSGRLLRLAGVHDEEGEFRDRVRELGIAEHVTVMGYTTDPDAVFRALDIVVFPNQGVGLGRPVAEAAAFGKPVVASGSRDGGGILVPDVTGLLVPTGDEGALSNAIGRLVTDASLRSRLGDAAARHAEQFSPAHAAARVTELWSRVLG